MAFHEVACLARCNGLDVQSFRAATATKEQFIEAIKETCSSTNQILVIAYSRKTLKQTGDGHYSPIGGYDPISNSALVLDVARFKVHSGPLPSPDN